jgi:hypothetical protein
MNGLNKEITPPGEPGARRNFSLRMFVKLFFTKR